MQAQVVPQVKMKKAVAMLCGNICASDKPDIRLVCSYD
jgi:hypothetical protein